MACFLQPEISGAVEGADVSASASLWPVCLCACVPVCMCACVHVCLCFHHVRLCAWQMSEVDEALAGVESMSVGTGFKEDFDGIIGIDLGTTYSCVAVWLDAEQRTEVFANAGV